MKLHIKVRNLREDLDYTQIDIANILGISRARYCLYENGHRHIPLTILDNICKIFDVSFDFLTERTNVKHYPESSSIDFNFFYIFLKEYRKEKKLSQKDLSEIFNCSQQAYSHYELGLREIPLNLIISLADINNLSIDYILGKTKINYYKKEKVPGNLTKQP